MSSPNYGPLERLRAATHDLHMQLERQSPMMRLMSQKLSSPEYIQILQGLYFCYARLVPGLANMHARLGELSPAWLEPVIYDRTADLGADLVALGVTRFEEPMAGNDLKDLPSVAAAAGRMYVLAGSSLGARVIEQALCKSLEPQAQAAIQFFRASSASVVQNWPHYRRLLAQALPDSVSEQAAVQEARQTFSCFLECFENQLQPA